jgi:virulence factor Mce-like protein
MTRRPQAALVASPVLVGAVTVLIACISVLLAVQANSGLPFVPTYDLNAQIPGGSNLVVGNEVRLGGFRVGQIDRISPAVSATAEHRAVAQIRMKLDKAIQPLPADTRVTIRPRSALGLKYIELTRGQSQAKLAAGATIPLKQSVKPIELDEFFSIWNEEQRVNQRKALEGYGTAFAGRGESINRAIRDLVPFVTHLEPVMRNLSDPDTELNNFFRQAGRTSGQIAPVARTYASLFVNMGITFEALSRHPESLRTAIERGAPTLQAGIRSFPVQRPFLRDSAELARLLEPVAEQIERSLPPTSDAFRVGTRVLPRAPAFYRRTRDVFRALNDLTANPNTLLALKDLRRAVEVLTPLVEYIAPYQTVCNYWNYYWTPLGEHVSEPVPGGTGQRSALKSDNRNQDNRVSDSTADRPVDIPVGMDPQEARDPAGQPLQALHSAGYKPAIDAQGNADCVVGQYGYLNGPLSSTGGRYPPAPLNPGESINDWSNRAGGGSHTVTHDDQPGLSGPTYKMRELGIDNVKDVP